MTALTSRKVDGGYHFPFGSMGSASCPPVAFNLRAAPLFGMWICLAGSGWVYGGFFSLWCKVRRGSSEHSDFWELFLPQHGRLGSPWNIPTDIGCVLEPDLAAKTSKHLSEGFQKLPGVLPSVFCTMNYTVLGSQIPQLSKETHKKTSMTVHLRLKCECSVACVFISA